MTKRALGGHPNAVIADWVHCRPCELLELARDAGPVYPDGEPVPEDKRQGWRLELRLNDEIDN